MAENKDSNFKITDRRKFNPDGTPRDMAAEPAPPAAAGEAPLAASANVVSFPGEPKKREPEPQAAPPAGAPEPAPQPAAAPRPSNASAAERAYQQASGPVAAGMPEASFLSLLNMLGVEAAMHMGLIEVPGTGGVQVDMETARHLIDLLGVLRVKTQGNLTPEEDSLFENMLADLRMQFVATSRRR